MQTIGISPKVWAPTALQLVALAANWIASGKFDRVELAQAIGAGLTALVGYFAGPGVVEEEIGPASDELLGGAPPDDESSQIPSSPSGAA